jgi:outer membrane protein OmpA-like peptidoglycan-associated protein
MHHLKLLVLLLLPLSLNAQDLVDNGGFEEYKGKLKKMGSVEMVKGWKSPTAAKADLFSELITEGPMSATRNMYGGQAPNTGQHYAGIRVYSIQDREPRSYLQATFNTPMTKGQKYCVKYYVSLSDLSRISTSEVRAFMSKVPVQKDDMASLTYAAQIPAPGTEVYDDLNEWELVCGIYEAEGDEQYMIIGNFMATKPTPTGKVKRPKGEVRPQQSHAYYYIDDVSVMPVRVVAECSCGAADKVRTGFVFGRSSMAEGNASTADKIDRQVFYFKQARSNVDGSMDPWIKEMAALMKADPSIKVKLVGHVDEVEKDDARTKSHLETLGEDRAQSVKEALVEQGVEASRITLGTPEEQSLKDTSGTEVGMSKNRRVEVELVR